VSVSNSVKVEQHFFPGIKMENICNYDFLSAKTH
jgi:hypothetical protein